MTTYIELQVTSHFSFLRGASSPDELFAAAALQGHSALGIVDRGSVAGLVRAWEAQKATGVRMIAGARVDLDDGRALLLYPTDKTAWSRLTRLLTLGKARAGKGGCTLGWSDVVAWHEGLIAILLPGEADAVTATQFAELRTTFGARGYCGLAFRRRPDDALRLHDLAALAGAAGVRAVALGDILYHAPEARLLQDVLTAIREKCTVDTLGYRRERHADRHLKSPAEMERRFAAFPDAIAATAAIARACTFDLGELSYQYPHERVVEGLTAQGALEQLTETAAARMAEADAFHVLGKDRRQGLWKVKGLGEDPLPLFAAADAREASFSPEGLEPDVPLRPLTEGREVVEDYRALQLSLRAHPLAFLRQDLTRRGIIRCADLAHIKDGRHVEVAGIILVRQKPGSAKGVLFITIEDETGIANGILWPDRFEAQRHTVMSAAMIGMKGRVQREGLVIHVICDRIIDHGGLLAQVGQMDFPHATGRGDGARHAGSPDRGDAGWRPGPRDSYWPPHANGMDPEQVVRIKSRDFH